MESKSSPIPTKVKISISSPMKGTQLGVTGGVGQYGAFFFLQFPGAKRKRRNEQLRIVDYVPRSSRRPVESGDRGVYDCGRGYETFWRDRIGCESPAAVFDGILRAVFSAGAETDLPAGEVGEREMD